MELETSAGPQSCEGCPGTNPFTLFLILILLLLSGNCISSLLKSAD